jgi:hypothetical protein
MKMTLNGLDDTLRSVERIERGAQRMNGYGVRIGSRLPYAYGQEYGHHRRGKRARRGGGVAYLRRAVTEVVSDGKRDIAEGLTKVRAPGPWVLKRLALWSRRLARVYAPRGPSKKSHSYRLWRSVKADVRQR